MAAPDVLLRPAPRPYAAVKKLLAPGTQLARWALYVMKGFIALLMSLALLEERRVTWENALMFPLIMLIEGSLFFYLPLYLFVGVSIRRLRRAACEGVRGEGHVVRVTEWGGRATRLRYEIELADARVVRVESFNIQSAIDIGATVDVWIANAKSIGVWIEGEGFLQAF